MTIGNARGIIMSRPRLKFEDTVTEIPLARRHEQTTSLTVLWENARSRPLSGSFNGTGGLGVTYLPPFRRFIPNSSPAIKRPTGAISSCRKINDNIHQHVSSTRCQAVRRKPRISRVRPFPDTDVTQLRSRRDEVFGNVSTLLPASKSVTLRRNIGT